MPAFFCLIGSAFPLLAVLLALCPLLGVLLCSVRFVSFAFLCFLSLVVGAAARPLFFSCLLLAPWAHARRRALCLLCALSF